MVRLTYATAILAVSAVAVASPLSRQDCLPIFDACTLDGPACCDGFQCVDTPWESSTPTQCLPAAPECYGPGERNVGADGQEYVPYAPCCDGSESVEVEDTYGRFCPGEGAGEPEASGEPSDEPEFPAPSDAPLTDEPVVVTGPPMDTMPMDGGSAPPTVEDQPTGPPPTEGESAGDDMGGDMEGDMEGDMGGDMEGGDGEMGPPEDFSPPEGDFTEVGEGELDG